MVFHGWFLHVTIWQDAATRSAVRGLILQYALNNLTLYMRKNFSPVEKTEEGKGGKISYKIVCTHVCNGNNAILNECQPHGQWARLRRMRGNKGRSNWSELDPAMDIAEQVRTQ